MFNATSKNTRGFRECGAKIEPRNVAHFCSSYTKHFSKPKANEVHYYQIKVKSKVRNLLPPHKVDVVAKFIRDIKQ